MVASMPVNASVSYTLSTPCSVANRAVEAHAGIYIALRERLKLAFAHFVELHEHVVPDFEVFAAGTRGRAIRRAGYLAGIVEHFGIRAAGACLAGGAPPVVPLGQIVNVGRVNAHIHPAVVRYGIARGVMIALEAGEIQLVLGDAEPLFIREEFPRERDGFVLEIIAERPVAQHFEERAMRSVAHFVDIAGANAFLHVGNAFARGVLFTHQIRHQRMHARGGEQNRRVVFRYQ